MHLINCYYTGPAVLDTLAEQIPGGAAALVQVFSRSHDPAVVRRLISAIRHRLPCVRVVGMTCYGTVLGDEVRRRDTLISVLVPEKGSFRCAVGETHGDPDAGRALGRELALTVSGPDTRCLLLFTNHDGIDPSSLLDGVQAACPGLPVAGGKAAMDPDNPDPTLVWCDDTITDHGAVLVALDGASLEVYQDFNIGVAPVGRPLQVTRSDGNRLMELDGEPVVEIYRRYLGQEVADSLPGSTLGLPLVVKREGIDVALDALERCEDGAMRYAAPLHEGEWVRFSFPHAERMLDGAAALAERLRRHGRGEALLVYACASRMWTLGEGAGVETTMLHGIAPLAGGLTGGEFCRTGDISQFLTQSLTTLLLRESTPADNTALPDTPNPLGRENYGVHLRTIKVLHGMVSRVTDELAEANRILRQERTFYRTLIEEMLDGLSLADAEGRNVYQSPSNHAIHGWKPQEVAGINVIDTLVHPDDQPMARNIWDRLVSRPGGRERLVCRIRHRQGHWITIEAQLRNCLDIPEISAVVSYFRDITELKRLEAELRLLATTDGLTALANRRFFLERARQEQRRATRSGTDLSVVVLDVDYFKRVNDTYGHAAGDRVLVSTAKLLQAQMRDQDLAGRLGGEEFAILLPETGRQGAIILADRLRATLEESWVDATTEQPLQVTASFGVATLHAGHGSIDQLLRRADEALYRAKDAGRNCVCTATD